VYMHSDYVHIMSIEINTLGDIKRGLMLEAQAEANVIRPRPKFWS